MIFIQKNFRKYFIKNILNIFLEEDKHGIPPNTTNPIPSRVDHGFSSSRDPNSYLLGKQSVANSSGIQSEDALENKLPENISHHDRPSILMKGDRFILLINLINAYKSASRLNIYKNCCRIGRRGDSNECPRRPLRKSALSPSGPGSAPTGNE